MTIAQLREALPELIETQGKVRGDLTGLEAAEDHVRGHLLNEFVVVIGTKVSEKSAQSNRIVLSQTSGQYQ
jgi:hypothetical protein